MSNELAWNRMIMVTKRAIEDFDHEGEKTARVSRSRWFCELSEDGVVYSCLF